MKGGCRTAVTEGEEHLPDGEEDPMRTPRSANHLTACV